MSVVHFDSELATQHDAEVRFLAALGPVQSFEIGRPASSGEDSDLSRSLAAKVHGLDFDLADFFCRREGGEILDLGLWCGHIAKLAHSAR